jgi:hypothetical protein
MDETQALTIISSLANGVSPLTGEVFPPDSPYQSPDVVRALFVAARALQSQSTNHRRADAPANAGKPWSEKEETELLAAFDRGISLANLARQHGRTTAGIYARLEKHGRVSPQQDSRRPPRAQSAAPPPDGKNGRAGHQHSGGARD